MIDGQVVLHFIFHPNMHLKDVMILNIAILNYFLLKSKSIPCYLFVACAIGHQIIIPLKTLLSWLIYNFVWMK